jgi:outer membrane immunogenic protein
MLPWSAAFRQGTVMKKLLGSIALLAMAMPLAAQAADLPPAPAYKAPVYVPPPSNWTGFYIGLNAGVAIDRSSYELDPAGCFLSAGANNCGVGGLAANPFRTFTSNLNNTGFTGGGQAGYNYQTGMVVWGVETDLNWNGVRESVNTNNILTGPLVGGNALTSVTQELDWFGTARGRLGITPTPTLLLYATGGLAYGGVKSTTNVLFPVTCCAGDGYTGAASTTRVGWTAGGGAEWMFAPNWSAKVEYLYIDLGKFSYNDPCVTPVCPLIATNTAAAYLTNATTREQVIRAGLNYHFNWGPVVARY